MLENPITDIAVPGIFAILVIRMVLDFIQKFVKKTEQKVTNEELYEQIVPMRAAVERIAHLTDDLHKWHDVSDNEGVKIWYVRKSLEDAIIRLSDTLEKQTEVFRLLAEQVKEMHRDTRRLSEKIGA